MTAYAHWLNLADTYLAANAAESGADELIRGLADLLRSGVIVPVEPTEAMLNELGDDGYNTEELRARYAAMLAALRQGSPVDDLEAFVNISDEQLDKAALQLFTLDNPVARWPHVNQHHYRQEAKSILDAALSLS